jgi:hypothetical protein
MATNTSNTTNSRTDALQLIKHVYDPVSKEYKFSWRSTCSARIDREMGQPVIVDFNNDGVPEVLVLDKVFNARTGELLVDGGLLADDSNKSTGTQYCKNICPKQFGERRLSGLLCFVYNGNVSRLFCSFMCI